MDGMLFLQGWTGGTLLGLVLSVMLVLAGVVFWLYRSWDAIQCRRGGWRFVAPVLGWLLIGLATLGGLLPIFPGFPLAILGLMLLGPNDPVIRRVWLALHHVARALADSLYPRRQRLGQRLLAFELRLARAVYRHGELPPWVEERIQQEQATQENEQTRPSSYAPES